LPRAGGAAAMPVAPEVPKKRVAPADPRGKPARPRPRRPSKPETKEQTWNDDSPFMPVQTPKK